MNVSKNLKPVTVILMDFIFPVIVVSTIEKISRTIKNSIFSLIRNFKGIADEIVLWAAGPSVMNSASAKLTKLNLSVNEELGQLMKIHKYVN